MVWIIVLMLFLLSIVCMFSSSSRLLAEGQSRVDVVKEQCITVLAGLAILIILYNIKNIKVFRVASSFGFLLSFVLLFLLDIRINTSFVRAIEINEAYRILMVAGVQIHVFEVVKVAMVMYLAWAVDSFKRDALPLKRLSAIWRKIIFMYAPFLLIFVMIVPGSNSSALFIGGVMFIVILLGGGNLKDMLILGAAGIAAIGVCLGIYHLSGGKYLDRIGTGVARIFDNVDYEKQLLTSERNTLPWQKALDKIRQPYAAKIAIKEGGVLGKGPGQSTQRYVVPDISEDYIYSFIIEEYGLVGGLLVIFLYISLLARGSIIVRNCGGDNFAKLSVAGLCILISGQAFLHMFVNADIGPMTGQTLPLVSHGTSAFLCFSIAFGIILSLSRIAYRRIERETREADPLVSLHESGVKSEMSSSLDDLGAFEDSLSDNNEV